MPSRADDPTSPGPQAPPATLELDGLEPDFDESFDGDELDPDRWLPCYLPQWADRASTAARYRVHDGRLVLRVDEDQPPWAPDLDGPTRVSSLQTGLFSGPVGSTAGQHHFRPGLTVRQEQPALRLYTPRYGVVEVRAAASDDPHALVALWMIGFEDEPHRSAEICVMEIFGKDVGEGTAAVGTGVHPFGDPTLVDDFVADRHPIDAREMHRYAVRWTPHDVAFYLDRSLVRVVHQSPAYPMQLMLNVYDLDNPERRGAYPKELVVDYVRGYPLPG